MTQLVPAATVTGIPVTVRNAWPCDPPVDNTHMIPGGWDAHLSETSALRKVVKGSDGQPSSVLASRVPILISAWVANRTSGVKMLEVSWKGVSKWHRAVVPRGDLMDTSKIVAALGPKGAPVNGVNRRLIVDWLWAYEDANIHVLQKKVVSSQMGWQRDGGFLCGHTAIGCDVAFHAAEEGDAQLASAMETRGTLEGWCEAVAPAANYPRVALALYASMAAPLLEILDAANFAVDWSYRTSTGKTTTLRVGASVWGSPDERKPSAFLSTWATTRAALELTAATRTHLPMILDDTKRAESRFQSEIPKMIYDLTQGRGKMRGASGGKGTLTTRGWRTVVMTTGESRVIDESKDGGLVTRVLSLWGSPFGSDGRETYQVVVGINRGLQRHHGHAGRKLIEWLVSRKARWPELRSRYIKLTEEYSSRLEGRGSASRMADYLAVLDLAGWIAHDCLPLPWAYSSPIRDMMEELTESHVESDRALEALRHVYPWAIANREKFWAKDGSSHEPHSGWLGRWDKDSRDLVCRDWEYLGVFRHVLVDQLLKAGYDSGVLRLWRDRGWLMHEDKKMTKRVRMPGGSLMQDSSQKSSNSVGMVAIRRGALEDLEDDLEKKGNSHDCPF